MRAQKCNRCGVLYEPKVGDLQIQDVEQTCKPPKGHEDSPSLWSQAIIDEDDPYDLCTACSNDLREFLKPITRPTARTP